LAKLVAVLKPSAAEVKGDAEFCSVTANVALSLASFLSVSLVGSELDVETAVPVPCKPYKKKEKVSKRCEKTASMITKN